MNASMQSPTKGAITRRETLMLPLDMASFTGGFTGSEIADHFGIKDSRTIPD